MFSSFSRPSDHALSEGRTRLTSEVVDQAEVVEKESGFNKQFWPTLKFQSGKPLTGAFLEDYFEGHLPNLLHFVLNLFSIMSSQLRLVTGPPLYCIS
ncbi:hypothetical protein MKW98_014980 [Papaver atlanticum]|uniref:Uncharacterized protein n=1 Tax=Papaver atlanticum TaxID=357466 RepID=A0AAD4XIU4_9MAGN|nr:hypothetical protein MKW98_014980 [Papaver atlanticum]